MHHLFILKKLKNKKSPYLVKNQTEARVKKTQLSISNQIRSLDDFLENKTNKNLLFNIFKIFYLVKYSKE